MSSGALIVTDFEKEWIKEDSDYFVGDISDVIEKTNKLIDFCRKNGYRIIFTSHIEEDSDEEFAPDSENVEIVDEIDKKQSDVLIRKNRISPFFRTELESYLQ